MKQKLLYEILRLLQSWINECDSDNHYWMKNIFDELQPSFQDTMLSETVDDMKISLDVLKKGKDFGDDYPTNIIIQFEDTRKRVLSGLRISQVNDKLKIALVWKKRLESKYEYHSIEDKGSEEALKTFFEHLEKAILLLEASIHASAFTLCDVQDIVREVLKGNKKDSQEFVKNTSLELISMGWNKPKFYATLNVYLKKPATEFSQFTMGFISFLEKNKVRLLHATMAETITVEIWYEVNKIKTITIE